MNKITKLGVSALCGSLAAVSAANAGDLTVTGGVDLSWIEKHDQTTGNSIGMGSNLTFAGSGELDNGWGVALSVALTNAGAYSNVNATVTIPALGDVRIDAGTSGTGIDRYDDITPNVWEEAYGTGLGTAIDTVSGTSGGSNIEWTPNMLPDGLTARIAYSPSVPGANANDKASAAGTDANPEGSGYDVVLEASDAIHGMSGLTIYAGMANVNQDSSVATYDGDQEEQTLGFTYAVGSFTVGYQWSEEDLGLSTTETQYDNTGYGITFNINDDLSVGFNHYESDMIATTGNVTAEAESFQIAYVMGGASIRLAEADSTNEKYQTAVGYDNDATTLSVALAF